METTIEKIKWLYREMENIDIKLTKMVNNPPALLKKPSEESVRLSAVLSRVEDAVWELSELLDLLKKNKEKK